MPAAFHTPLDAARATYWEDPKAALATAIECAESARVLGDGPLRARVLMRVAALLVDGLRARDTVVRTGGEEFVILMPDTEPRAAAACCERLCAAIHDESWDELAPGLAVTASIGLACSPGDADVEALAKTADRRLYEAKRAGRDRVVA